MLPLFLRIRILKDNSKGFGLFIPLILVWIILFALLIALGPFILIISLIMWKRRYGKIILAAYPILFSMIGSLSGLKVKIENINRQVSILIK